MNPLVLVALVAVVVLLGWAFHRKRLAPASVDPAIIAAFRKIYRRQLLLSIPTAIFLVWVFESPSNGGALHEPLPLVAGIVVVWACLHTYRYWRCPKCGARLGRNPTYDWQCPKCGTALREPRDS